MRIERVEIEEFGKLSAFEWEPDSGFQVVFGNNEDGKSTLMAFLKLMLYGDTGRYQALERSPRKRYRPWDGGPMRGAVEFTARNKAYRLEKTFGETAGRDRVRLLEKGTGEAVPLGKGEEVGARFLGLNLSEFERTCFVSSTGAIAADSQHDDIAKRLMENLSASGEETVSPQEVLGRLRGAAEKLVSKRGNRGELAEARQKLDELREEQARVRQQLDGQKALRERYDTLRERQKERTALRRLLDAAQAEENRQRIETLIADYRAAAAQEALSETAKRAEGLEKEMVTCGRLAQALDDELCPLFRSAEEQTAACQAARSEWNEREAAWREIAPAAGQREALAAERERLRQERERLEAEERAQREHDQPVPSTQRSFSPGLLLAGAGVCAAAIAAALATQIWFLLGGAAIGVVLLLAAFFRKPRASHTAALSDEAGQARRARLEQLNQRLQAIAVQWETLPAEQVTETARRAEEEARSRLEREEALAGVRREMLHAGYVRFTAQAESEALNGVPMPAFPAEPEDFDADACGEYLKNVIRQKQQALTALLDASACASVQALREKADRLAARKAEIVGVARGMGLADDPAAWEEARERYRRLGEGYDPARDPSPAALREQLEALGEDEQETLTSLLQQMRMPERLPEQIQVEADELSDSVREMAAYYDALNVAAEGMEQAIEELRQSFSPELNRRTGEILAALTGGKYRELLVSPSYELRVKTGTQFYEYAYMSDGTVDQAYLALRLAIAERISPDGEPLPLFLDDVLMQYDDARTAHCLRFLQAYAAQTGAQLVLFTCHGFVADTAAAQSVPCRRLA